WRDGPVKRVLRNEKYLGRLIWGQKTYARRPGTREEVARPQPRSEWRTLERPELRIVPDDLWARVQTRLEAVREAIPEAVGRRLMRGRKAALHSPHLFSGFMRCGVCGGAVTVVSGGCGSPRYGCQQSSRNGRAACSNRLT